MLRSIAFLNDLCPSLKELHPQKLPWSRAWHYLIAIGGAAYTGALANYPRAGVIAALCAMLILLNDLGGPIQHRLWTLAATAIGILLGGLIGGSIDFITPSWFFAFLFICGLLVGKMHNSSIVVENIARFLHSALWLLQHKKLQPLNLFHMRY